MILTAHRNLGLAVTEEGITAVEVSASGGRRTVLRTAAMAFAPGLGLDQPERLGKELKQVLRRSGVQASRCIIGLAATWTAAREKRLPATDDESLRGVLSIASEREFASGSQELAFDYCRCPSDKGVSALLVAAPRRVIDQLAAMARAAGLSVVGMTSSAVALALAGKEPVPAAGRLILCLSPGGAELAVRSAAGVCLVRPLPVRMDRSGDQADALSAEIRPIVSLAPAGPGSAQDRELWVWDSLGVEPDALESVGRRLGLPVRRCAPESDLDLAAAAGTPLDGRFAHAAALACSNGSSLALDFLHPRLAPPRKPGIRRRALWGAGVLAAILAAALYLVLDWRLAQRDVEDLRAQKARIRDAAERAKALADEVSFAAGWYDHRPRFLDCLLEITQAFPEEGRVWATNLVVKEDMQVLLTGKSVSEAAALEVMDRLKANPRLANVRPLYIRQAGGASREVSFAVNLSLRGAR